MRNLTYRGRLILVSGASFCLSLSAGFGGDTNSIAADATTASPAVVAVIPATNVAATTISATPPASSTAPTRLPYGVEDVVKLSRGQMSDDVILTYIQNSGTVYNLSPTDIVYLRDQGVSDSVLNAMQNQRSKAMEAAAQTLQQPAALTQTFQPDTSAAAGASSNPQYAPVYTPPAPTYVQPAPAETQAAASTVYVIPYPAATAAYYGYPAYYGPYYNGYYGPVVSIGYVGGYRYYGGPRYYGGGAYRGGYWHH